MRRTSGCAITVFGVFSWLFFASGEAARADELFQAQAEPYAAVALQNQPATPAQPFSEVADDLRPITQLTANIANKQQTAEGDALEVPQGVAVERFPQTVIPQPFGFSRSNLIGLDVKGLEDWTWEGTSYLWDAPDLCHAAVHFEETYVERCGHSWGLAQPLFSVLHYYGTIPTLPYRIVAYPAKECQYTLGECRPDSCSLFHWYRLPRWSTKAALATGAFYTGMNYVIP